ncbi:MAG: hypothetical protein HY756_03820 [Nitrospirae bacterium]|nr:hypothetical protein [Nitrospirota bacterium]
MKIECPLDKIKRVKAEQVKDAIGSEGTVFLDVREIEEYASGHIKGSVNIPLRELEYRIDEVSRDKEVVPYCRSGSRSLGASILLCSHGFQNIMHLEGGILKWPYELEKGFPEEKAVATELTEELLETFRLALSLEKGSMIFYERASEKVEDPSIKERLTRLRLFEKKHLEKILQYYFFFSGEDPALMKQYIDSVDPLYTEGKIEINSLLLRFDESFIDEKQVLEIAMQKEVIAKDLYTNLAALAKEPRAVAVFNVLANEEKGHIDFLSDAIKALA